MVTKYILYLGEEVAKGPTHKGSEGLGNQRVLIKGIVVSSPSRNRSTTDGGSVTEKWALEGTILAQRGFGNSRLAANNVLGDRSDSKGRSRKARSGNNKAEKLHFTNPSLR
jgi:hypothetical protein